MHIDGLPGVTLAGTKVFRRGVHVVGRGNDHGVEFRPHLRDHDPEVLEHGDVGKFRAGVRRLAVVHVAHRHQVLGLGDGVHEPLASSAHADERDVELLGRLVGPCGNLGADRVDAVPVQGHVLSAPLLVYRLLMLAWALWLAWALVGWIRWGWESFAMGGHWRQMPRLWVPSLGGRKKGKTEE